MMAKLSATFITMFHEPLTSWLNTSIIAKAHKKDILSTHVESILNSVNGNHHLVDDTPYGGGPGELMKVDVIAPLIKNSLAKNPDRARAKKRVLLMDPAGVLFDQHHAKRLSEYEELIFVCGRYEGIDARIHHFVDEAISIGDYVLSSGDLAAMVIFDATARMVDGVLGNSLSSVLESHHDGRLEGSHYTRPAVFEGFEVPKIYQSGNHQEIKKMREIESLRRTKQIRSDLVEKYPFTDAELKLLQKDLCESYPWMKTHE